jgi:hypothetical protein
VTSDREPPRETTALAIATLASKSGPPGTRNAASELTSEDSLSALERILDAAMTIAKPLVEHVAPAVGYKASKWAGMSDSIAQTAASVTREAIRAGYAEDEVAVASTSLMEPSVAAAPARSGIELVAHAMTIQGQLDAVERSWVGRLIARHSHLLEELRDVVADMTVDQGVAAVRHLRAVQSGLTEAEGVLFERVVAQPRGLRVLLDLIGGRTIDEAVAVLRDAIQRRSTGAEAHAS